MTIEITITHHGTLLKTYVEKNGINRAGRLNKLIEALGLSRQAIYVMYGQKTIKKKHREIIIKHLGLVSDFFPEDVEDNDFYIIALQKQVIQLQNDLLKANQKIHELSVR